MEPRVLQHDVKGEGPPLVLVPGGLTGWLSWIPHQERLSRRYQTIRVQPIHNELGSAGVPGDPEYGAETEREALRLTLDALGLETTHLAGWSAGGKAAIEFAMEYPDRVRSLALVEPGAFWILEQLGERTEDVEGEMEFAHRLSGQQITEDDLAEMLVRAGFVASPEAARSHPNWERWAVHRMTLSWRGERLDRPARTIEDLARITCPTILFKGTVSAELERRIVDVIAERLPDASVVELDGDHACHIQSIDAFLEALEQHLMMAGG